MWPNLCGSSAICRNYAAWRLRGMRHILPNHGAKASIAAGGYGPGLIDATERYVRHLIRCRSEPELRGLDLWAVVAQDLAAPISAISSLTRPCIAATSRPCAPHCRAPRRRNAEVATMMPTDRAQPFRKEAVLRPRQAEIFAQGLALVLAAEQAAPLQLGHDQVDEVVEPARQVGEHHVEAVARRRSRAIPASGRRSSSACPSWRARHSRRAGRRAGAPSGSRARPASITRSRPLLLWLVSGISGNGPSGSNLRASTPSRDRQRGDAAVVVHQAVEPRALLACASSSVSPTMTKAPGRIFRWSGVAADLAAAALHVGVEGAAPRPSVRRRRTPPRPSRRRAGGRHRRRRPAPSPASPGSAARC